MKLKYGNKKTVVDNINFDSKREANRYGELRLLERAKEISHLEIQPKFVLQIGFTDNEGVKHRPITYIADFMYYEIKRKTQWVVEDCKGMRTEVYKIKKKMFLYNNQDYIFREV